jgi:glycosyltransferase involved in cell wall biosynthesis
VGGPARTVPGLCRSVMAAAPECLCEIVTTRDGPFGPNLDTPGVVTHSVSHRKRCSEFPKLLEQVIAKSRHGARSAVIVHDHGQWLASNRTAAAVARRHGIPRVVSPRGMLTPWALRHHGWKKKAAWWAFAGRDIRTADLVHATSQEEANELRALGVRQPIAVIPNGVEPWSAPPDSLPQKANNVLFLSRLHVKKGIRELVAAWRQAQPGGWRLVLAGPDEGHLVAGLQLTARDAIDYVGEVTGDDKWRLLASAGVVVLPSHSENFGVVVAEALMAGTPVIATHGTPWSDLETHRCGWWIPLSVNQLAETIQAATSLSPQTLEGMGQRGREWMNSDFSWASIGANMAAVYLWLAGAGRRPECVLT